jgi:DNA-binding CsgD family transcriptional regulator
LEGHIHMHRGRVERALESQRACGEVMSSLLIRNPSAMPWRSEASQALRLLGDREEARELAQEELDLAIASGSPRAIGVALRAAGTVTDAPAGVQLLERAVETLAPCGARLEQARAQVELGAAIRRSGRRREARPALQAGLELAQASGAVLLARRAETELRAAGGRGRRATDTGPERLTASERRVAELAARGHTNRHIAGLLQISIKAVEWHLHQSYRKLDIHGRRQLPEALTATG